MSTSPRPLGHFRSFDALRDDQDARLEDVLRRVAESPFYRDRYAGRTPRRLGPLDEVGLTAKADIRRSYPFGMLAVPRAEVASYHESSGSSGSPTPSFFTAGEWEELADRFNRKAVELTAEDTLLVRMPYAIVMVGLLGHLGAWARGATVVPGDCRTLAAPYPQIVRILRDLEVTVSWSSPSETLALAAACGLAGQDPAKDFPDLRALYVAGEPLSPARRARIEAVWDRPVVEEYGCTEMGPMGGSCPHGRLHFFADRVLPEVIDDETGAIAREGTGRLVLTPLYREAMPLLRYDLEDRVTLRNEGCPCGWNLPTLQVLGRTLHTYQVAGRPLSPVRVEEAVFRLPAEHGVMFWRGRAEPDVLEIQIEVSPDREREACARLSAIAPEVLGVPCRVSAVPTGTLVPHRVLEMPDDAMKPRRLFGPGENWDGAVLRS